MVLLSHYIILVERSAPVVSPPIGKLSCKMKSSFNFASFPKGKSDRNALSLLLLYNRLAREENQACKRYETLFCKDNLVFDGSSQCIVLE